MFGNIGMFNGIEIGAIELIIYFIFCNFLTKIQFPLRQINAISYYWIMVTILTGLWEAGFIFNNYDTCELSQKYLNNSEHVWFNTYDITYVVPWKLSKIFYAEYGAYADREYMTLKDDWSRIIESTHAFFCGLFSLLAVYNKIKNNERNYLILINVAMGSQLMNSLLYMAKYFNTLTEVNSVNYVTDKFPAGVALTKRPFMYVNIFWTLMPAYVILVELKKKTNNYNINE